MKKAKEFCKNHKRELSVAGVLVGTALGVFIGTKIPKKNMMDTTGLDVISWDPTIGNFVTLERVKEVLEENIGNAKSLAIVKEGWENADAYSIIELTVHGAPQK